MSRLSALLGLCLLGGVVPPSSAQARTGCLVHEADPSRDTYLAALRIETRKAGLEWEWIGAASQPACAKRSTVLSFVTPERASLRLVDGSAQTIDLQDLRAGERARGLARRIVQTLSDRARTVPLLAAKDDLQLGASSEPVEMKATTAGDARPALMIRAGAIYLYQFGAARHLGGPSLEAGLSLFESRLAVSLLGGYLAGAEADEGRARVDVSCGELILMLRGGWKFSDFRLRFGLGLGWERRDVITRSNSRAFQDGEASSDSGLVAFDLELTWHFAESWHLGALMTSRAYFSGAEHLWLGQTVYGAIPGALGGQVALGFTR